MVTETKVVYYLSAQSVTAGDTAELAAARESVYIQSTCHNT